MEDKDSDFADEVAVPLEKKSEKPKNDVARGNWNNKAEFLLSCIGLAVGFGNVWRFPYLCYRNGGGVFLIPYVFFMTICVIPLLLMEFSYAQFSGLSPITVWRLSPLFKGIGYGMVIISGIVGCYYNVIVAWAIFYFISSFRAEVPWASCQNSWNDEFCVASNGEKTGNFSNTTKGFEMAFNYSSSGEALLNDTVNVTLWQVNTTVRYETSSEQFWQNNVLQITSGIEEIGVLRWELLLCSIGAWLLTFICMVKGIKTSGKAVYVTATVPYVILAVLLVRGLTLPGSLGGVIFYLIPEWEKLLNFKVWGEAAAQIFYSTGVGWGGLLTYASYNPFHHNCLRDSILISVVDTITCLFAGLVVFTVIGFMAYETGEDISKVVRQGPGLAFVVYPEAAAKLPLSPLWSVLFFGMLIMIGLGSQFGQVETLVSSLTDEFPRILRPKKTILTGMVCLIQFLVSLMLITQGGVYILQVMDWYCATLSLLVISVSECVVIAWVYGLNRFCKDITLMVGRPPPLFFKVCWLVVTPLSILFVLIFSLIMHSPVSYGDYVYPEWTYGIGWVIALCSILPIPLLMVIQVARTKGSPLQRIRGLIRPSPEWGPSSEEKREMYRVAYQTHSETKF
ncbi:sodium- and chloride-dependent glycine transporter 1 [Lingula anatina]|uniref:Transporter n=1 Tax=Lingula anatina TaxID=7574 RepID=A0A1S3JSU9_LINAN|nr:sodium- and chloride-dependent glycine transporter 1 [Lingula anatina]|eukprot:XP_013413428.1 sodium- and chloride-dependent glycine transporter 1 [Lingula anatina]